MIIYIPILAMSAIVALLVCLARPLVSSQRARQVRYYALRLVGVDPHTMSRTCACGGAGTSAQCALHRDSVPVAGSCRDASSLDLRRVRERQQAMFEAVRDIHFLNYQQEELERALKAASHAEGAGMA